MVSMVPTCANNADVSFQVLRGLYQAVEAMLLGDALRIVHTRGHAQEPWNDFVDAAAKQEAKQSMFLPRQTVDLRMWQDDIPHLWTYLDSKGDLPVLRAEGFLMLLHQTSQRPLHTLWILQRLQLRSYIPNIAFPLQLVMSIPCTAPQKDAEEKLPTSDPKCNNMV